MLLIGLCAKTWSKMLKLTLLFVMLFGISSSAVIGNASSQGLYSAEDDVLILTSNNFKQELYGHNRSILIEFYNTWCGFCQRYAPIWKALATDIKSWKDVLTIAVIDCANDLNAPVCTEFEVLKYPTLRYFHPNYQPGAGNNGVHLKTSFNQMEELKMLAALLITEQIEGRGSIFPNLQPFQQEDVSQMFDATPEVIKYGILIVQDSQEYVGALLAMDFHALEQVIIRYTFLNNSSLLETLKVPAENSVIFIERGSNKPEILSLGSLDRMVFKNSIYRALLTRNISIQDTNMNTHESDTHASLEKEEVEIGPMDDTVYQVDLESALRYSLKREIGGLKNISAEHMLPVQKYVKVLKKYFPFGKNGKDLLNNITDYVSEEGSLSGTTIRKMILEADKSDQKVFSSSQGWIRCKGSQPQYRGYPCSMWTLFHYMTVNADIDNQGLSNFDNEVLDAMYHYIKNFFGCRDCSNHFVERAEKNGLFNVKSYEEAILWLWRVHNNVNMDLAGDPTEDPQHPKLQFPSKINCPQCYYKDKSWNKDEVLKYLKKIYSRRHISYTGANINVLDVPADYLKSTAAYETSNTILVLLIGMTPLIWKQL